MAITGFTRSDAEAVLKYDYLPTIRDNINQSTPAQAELEGNTENVVGLEAHIALHLGRSEAVGARGETDDLPTARKQEYDKSRFWVRYNYGRIEVTLPVIEGTKSDEGAYLRGQDSEMKRLTNDLKEDFGRQLVSNDDDGAGPNDGASGRLATCGTTSNSTTVVLADTETAVTFRRLRAGMYIDIVDVSASGSTLTTITNGSNVLVTAVDPSAKTITVGTAVTTTSDEIIVRHGSYGNEMRGIKSIVQSSGALQGVTHDEWESEVLTNATDRPISEDLLQQLVDGVDIRSGTVPDAFLVEHTQNRAYGAELMQMKRVANSTKLKGGFTALTFNDNIPLIVDRQFDNDKVIAYNRKHLSLYENSDWKWIDLDGAVLSRVSGKAAFEATLYKYCDLGTDRRNAHGALEDLSV